MSKFMAEMVRRMAKDDYAKKRELPPSGLTPEERRTIALAYSKASAKRPNTDAIRYIRRDCGKQSLAHFLDTAEPGQVSHLKALLDIA